MIRTALKELLPYQCFYSRSNKRLMTFASRCCHGITREPVNAEFLRELLNIDESKASKTVTWAKRLQNLPRYNAKKVVNILQKHEISMDDISTVYKLLKINPLLLEHRIMMLQEVGIVTIDVNLLKEFYRILQFPVSYLKECRIIPVNADVTQNLLNCFDKPPDNAPPINSLSDECCIRTIHLTCMRYYLRWKLDMNEYQIENFITKKAWIRYRSYRLLNEILQILENDIGMTKDKIRKHIFCLQGHPGNIRRILEEVECLGKADIKRVLHISPKITAMCVESILEKIQVLKANGIPEWQYSTCLKLFTMKTRTVIKRFNEFNRLPHLRIYDMHPRKLSIVYWVETVKRRLKILQEHNLKSATVHVLLMAPRSFNQYLTNGSDRSKGKDMLKYLSFELDVDYMPLAAVMRRHVLWCQIPLVQIDETLRYLRQEHYSNEEVYENAHILLYDRRDVQKTLEAITLKKLDSSYDWTPSQRLALCLYYIERSQHFSGHGAYSYMRKHDDPTSLKDCEDFELKKLSIAA